jgi:hypothetical protein
MTPLSSLHRLGEEVTAGWGKRRVKCVAPSWKSWEKLCQLSCRAYHLTKRHESYQTSVQRIIYMQAFASKVRCSYLCDVPLLVIDQWSMTTKLCESRSFVTHVRDHCMQLQHTDHARKSVSSKYVHQPKVITCTSCMRQNATFDNQCLHQRLENPRQLPRWHLLSLPNVSFCYHPWPSRTSD